METVDPQETPPARRNPQRVLVAAIIVLGLFIVICLGLITYLTISQKAPEPRPMTLQHPSGEIVPGGLTQEDLGQAIELTRDSGLGAITGNHESVKQSLDEMGQLVLAGRLVELESGSDCLLLEARGSMCKVQMTQGARSGQTFWVPQEYVGKGGGQAMGFCCASIYVRYLVTAGACCWIIYLLRLRSIILQIIIFILGMVLLNLLWGLLVQRLMQF